MAINNGMMSSKTNEWSTPQNIFDDLDQEFHFTLDPCCTHENAKCEKHYTITENGLIQDWSKDIVFMNPPYGRKIGHWIKKAYEASLEGATVVCLIPSRTDTAYWHDYVMTCEIRYIRGRLYFGDGTGPAPFPSAIVIFRGSNGNG
jgi:site-specific DNA-methyltransferase (adenine-specific)